MGLDWVVVAREDGEVPVYPTEILGARRASRDDSEVLAELRRIWESGAQESSFDEFVEQLVSQEVPPVVIGFGEGCESAAPAVVAEGQYYGYRAKAIEPSLNRISVFAEQNGIEMDWLYDQMRSEAEIRERIELLETIFDRYRSENPEIVRDGEMFYADWRRAPGEWMDHEEKYAGGDAEVEEHLFEIYAFLGAIDWLRFWADKGFQIAAEY